MTPCVLIVLDVQPTALLLCVCVFKLEGKGHCVALLPISLQTSQMMIRGPYRSHYSHTESSFHSVTHSFTISPPPSPLSHIHSLSISHSFSLTAGSPTSIWGATSWKRSHQNWASYTSSRLSFSVTTSSSPSLPSWHNSHTSPLSVFITTSSRPSREVSCN